MGLTISYRLSLQKRVAGAVVRELVERTALYARKIGCAEVGEITPVADDTPGTFWHVLLERYGERYLRSIPAKRGWIVEVWPGEGCESALFGLCQYPRRTPHIPFDVSTGASSGWDFRNYCKTQYANEHGWDHFLRCHKTIISILNFWQKLGVTVETNDEGGYWESRSEEQLKEKLRQYDGLIAMAAGVFKDAGTEAFPSVESPIFARNDFERLEAEGWREFGSKLPIMQPLLRRPNRSDAGPCS